MSRPDDPECAACGSPKTRHPHPFVPKEASPMPSAAPVPMLPSDMAVALVEAVGRDTARDLVALAGTYVKQAGPSSGEAPEKPVCDRCGEEDSDERLLGKVDTCQTCVASDAYRIEQLTSILARWMGEFASPGMANVVGRAKRESDLWAACENAGIKPASPFTRDPQGGT